jgi:hypothetical protein
MRVKELIEQLSHLNPESTVIIYNPSPNLLTEVKEDKNWTDRSVLTVSNFRPPLGPRDDGWHLFFIKENSPYCVTLK